MELARHSFRAMGCPCEVRLYAASQGEADEVARAAIAEVARLEAKYSRYRDDSLASRINASAGDPAGVEVDDETAALLDYAETSYQTSDGLFDITSGVLRRVWDFKSGRVPHPREVDEVLELVGWRKVRWDRPRIALPLAGMQVDFGGYVKEYAADRVAELCRGHGIDHGLVDLGGDIAVVGPHPDGSTWGVGVRHPRAPQSALASVWLGGGAIASSGDYERFMVVDGVRYGHILDPRSGWPVSGLVCVSVLANHCLIAGTATTVAMLKGEKEGCAWLDELGLPNLRVTQGGEVGGTLADTGRCSEVGSGSPPGTTTT